TARSRPAELLPPEQEPPPHLRVEIAFSKPVIESHFEVSLMLRCVSLFFRRRWPRARVQGISRIRLRHRSGAQAFHRACPGRGASPEMDYPISAHVDKDLPPFAGLPSSFA